MKKTKLIFFAFIAMFVLSASSAIADVGYAYVKVTTLDGTDSWVKILGETYEDVFNPRASYVPTSHVEWRTVPSISKSTEGIIDLREVWSEPDGKGIHYIVHEIDRFAFAWCKQITKVILPEDVETIGEDAFMECTSLAEINIPNNVSTIKGFAFNNCSGLTSVVIPNSVTSIENGAFNGCTGLTEIILPQNLKTIGYDTFRGCDNLLSVVSFIEDPSYVGFTNGIFDENTTINGTLYVPKGTKSLYKRYSTHWNINNIVEMDMEYDLEITDAELATMFISYPVEIPENDNIKGVYYAKEIVDGELVLEELKGVIPANTAVIVSATPSIYTFHRSAKILAELTDNLLVGTDSELDVSEIDGKVLTLGHGETSGNVGFYEFTGVTLQPNKAYIVLPASSDVKELGIEFNGVSTNIKAVENNVKSNAVYNVLGQKVMANTKLSKGLYIVNGKKVLVR